MTPSKGVIADNPNLSGVKARDDGFHDHSMPAIDMALIPTFPQIAEQREAHASVQQPSDGVLGTPPPGPLGP